MAKKKSVKQQVIHDYLDKWSDLPTATLARKIYKENNALWSNTEACMTAVRRARGNQGKDSRKVTTDKTHYRPNGVAGAVFSKLPEGKFEIDGIIGAQVNGPCKVLVISDLHVPYHNKQSMELAIQFAVDNGVDTVLLNGDIFDCHAISRWQTDPREKDFAGDLDTMKLFLSLLREAFPSARIIYKWGNHEDRYVAYMILKAPELLDVKKFQLASILECLENGIETVEQLQVIKLGKLNVLHGHEYRFSISNPVNPARGLFLRAKVNALCGHFHQPSQHSENSLDGNTTSCWSIGCLSDLHPRFMPLNKWTHGFAIVEVDADNAFSVSNFRIIDGKIWN